MKKKWRIIETDDKEHCFLKKFGFNKKKKNDGSNKPREIVYVNRKKQANNWDLTSHSKQEIDV